MSDRFESMLDACEKVVSGNEEAFVLWLLRDGNGEVTDAATRLSCRMIVSALVRSNPRFFVQSVSHWMMWVAGNDKPDK